MIEPPPAGLPEGIEAAIPLNVFVALKSGDVVGEHVVGIRLLRPNGTVVSVREVKMMFNGAENGANIQLGFALKDPQEGLYWFDVLWSEDVLTRIPLRVKARSAVAAPEPIESEST